MTPQSGVSADHMTHPISNRPLNRDPIGNHIDGISYNRPNSTMHGQPSYQDKAYKPHNPRRVPVPSDADFHRPETQRGRSYSKSFSEHQGLAIADSSRPIGDPVDDNGRQVDRPEHLLRIIHKGGKNDPKSAHPDELGTAGKDGTEIDDTDDGGWVSGYPTVKINPKSVDFKTNKQKIPVEATETRAQSSVKQQIIGCDGPNNQLTDNYPPTKKTDKSFNTSLPPPSSIGDDGGWTAPESDFPPLSGKPGRTAGWVAQFNKAGNSPPSRARGTTGDETKADQSPLIVREFEFIDPLHSTRPSSSASPSKSQIHPQQNASHTNSSVSVIRHKVQQPIDAKPATPVGKVSQGSGSPSVEISADHNVRDNQQPLSTDSRKSIERPRPWGQKRPSQVEKGAFDDVPEENFSQSIINAVPNQGCDDGTEEPEVDRLRHWQANLSQDPPKSLPSTPGLKSDKSAQSSSDICNFDREGSDYMPPPPVITYYSEDDSPVPELSPDRSPSPSAHEEAVLPDKDYQHQQDSEPSQPATVQVVTIPSPGEEIIENRGRPFGRSYSSTQDFVLTRQGPRPRLERSPRREHVDDLNLPSSPAYTNFSINSNDQPRSHRRTYGTESMGKWWKKNPHPIYSARFASQRLLIEFPCPVRNDLIKPTMTDHFSRYGNIRYIMAYETNGDKSEKAFVVFFDPESVKKCLEDPKKSECLFRSAPRLAATTLELSIKTVSPEDTYRTVWIRISGPRSDAHSRSASPTRRRRQVTGENNEYPGDLTITATAEDPRTQVRMDNQPVPSKLSLPPSIIVDAVPQKTRFGKINYWARLRPPAPEAVRVRNQTAYKETGNTPTQVGEIDLRRRVPEREIIPKLCDYFADIAEIFPPTEYCQGWLVTVDGPMNARHMMDQIAQIPGFSVRWANEGDGWHQVDRQSHPDDEVKGLVSPVTRLNRDLDGYPSLPRRRRGTITRSDQDAMVSEQKDSRNGVGEGVELASLDEKQNQTLEVEAELAENIDASKNIQASNSPHTVSSKTVSPGPPTPKTNFQTLAQQAPLKWSQLEQDNRYPQLRRTLIHTYKGRPLKEEITPNGEVRYYDERAVFVGRLVKEKENARSIFVRFSKYGAICSVEYNPQAAQTTYATARILYQDRESVARAIEHEDEAVSEGSALKVEVRRVLPLDVQTREMFIDSYGRAVSPSMASQYSPPSIKPFSNPPPDFIPPPQPSFGVPPQSIPQQWAMPGQPMVPPSQIPQSVASPYPQHPVYASGPMWIHLPPQMAHLPPPPNTPPPEIQQTPLPGGQYPMNQPVMTQSNGQPAGVYPQVLFALGIGYQPHSAPSPVVPVGFIPQQNWPTPPPSTPMTTEITYPTLAQFPPPPSASSVPVTPISPVAPDPKQPVVSIPSVSPEGTRKHSPTVVGTKFEDGIFKVIYDAEDLKRYRKEVGISEPSNPPPAVSVSLPLLPLSTGGHDSAIPKISPSDGSPDQYQHRSLSPVANHSFDQQMSEIRPSDRDRSNQLVIDMVSPLTADCLRRRFSGTPCENEMMTLGQQVEMERQRDREMSSCHEQKGDSRPRQIQYSGHRRASLGPGVSPLDQDVSLQSLQDTKGVNRLVPVPIPLLSPPSLETGQGFRMNPTSPRSRNDSLHHQRRFDEHQSGQAQGGMPHLDEERNYQHPGFRSPQPRHQSYLRSPRQEENVHVNDGNIPVAPSSRSFPHAQQGSQSSSSQQQSSRPGFEHRNQNRPAGEPSAYRHRQENVRNREQEMRRHRGDRQSPRDGHTPQLGSMAGRNRPPNQGEVRSYRADGPAAGEGSKAHLRHD